MSKVEVAVQTSQYTRFAFSTRVNTATTHRGIWN